MRQASLGGNTGQMEEMNCRPQNSGGGRGSQGSSHPFNGSLSAAAWRPPLISCSSPCTSTTFRLSHLQFTVTMSTQRNTSVGIPRAYAFRPPGAESSQPDTSFILKDVADEVTKFTQSTGALSPVKITNVKPLASYSWIEARTPTIAVPGKQMIDTIVESA